MSFAYILCKLLGTSFAILKPEIKEFDMQIETLILEKLTINY